MENEDLFASMWQRLMVKWETAYRSYQTAREAEKSLRDDHERNAERCQIEAKALQELQDVKRQIDELITEGARRHEVTKGSLVIGTLENAARRPAIRIEKSKNK